MLRGEFLESLRFRLAENAVGPTALNNQGALGVIGVARSFLKGLDLGSFVETNAHAFLSRLDKATLSLLKALPVGAQNWGAARIALNLFLRDALYCADVAAQYRLQSIRGFLEIPLDRQADLGLRRYPNLSEGLPRWKGIKHLSAKVSNQYQQVASKVAEVECLARVDLDVIFWRALTLQPAAEL
jgi:hypothetical protein